MGFLPSTAALTAMRNTVERSFDQEIIRWRVTRTADDSGGWTETIATATYQGRVFARQTIPTERVEGGRLTATAVWVVRLPWNADILPSDMLVLPDDTELQVTDDDDIKSTKLQLLVNCYRVT